MTTHIIESIGKWGVKTTAEASRFGTPKPGDVVLFADGLPYPFKNSRIGRVEALSDKGDLHICCELGSAFLFENGGVSISGGPFATIKLADLRPTFRLHEANFWNWGDNGSGAGNGVNYKIARPVFLYCPPGAQETDAEKKLKKITNPPPGTRYANLYLSCHKEEIGCGYFYTVTNGATSHTAFRSMKALIDWLHLLNLELATPLPAYRSENCSIEIKGEYFDVAHMGYDEFFGLPAIAETRTMSNGDYTLGRITADEDGIRTIHTLNPNCKHRPVYDYAESAKLKDD
jgi:hypothetical protein